MADSISPTKYSLYMEKSLYVCDVSMDITYETKKKDLCGFDVDPEM